MPLTVDRYELGPLQTNCYVVRRERGAAECAVIDPGGDAADLRLELARLGTSCVGILITHGHFDHLGGVADLAEGTGAEVWMTEGERERLERFTEFAPVGVPGQHVGKVSQDTRVDLIRLGQHAHGLGEVPGLPGIDPCDANTRALQRTDKPRS